MSEKLYLLGEEYEICSGDENYKMLRVSFDEWYGVFIRELDNEIYLDGKPHTVDKDALLRYLTKFSNGIYYWVEDMCKIFKYPNSREVHDFVRIDGAGNGYISERRSSFINERMKNQKSIIELQKKIPIPGEDYDDYLEIIKEYAEHTFLSVLLIFQERLDIMIFDYTVDFDEYNDTFSKLAKLVGKMDEKEHNQNKDKIRDLIMMNPYDERGYKLCVDMYGDSDNSLVNFAKWHKIELFSYKQKVLNDFFR